MLPRSVAGPVLLLLACWTATLATSAIAQDKPASKTKPDVDLIPIYRVFDRHLGEYLYVVAQKELDELAKLGENFVNEGIIGYGAAVGEGGDELVKLRRYVDKDGYHYFYNQLKRPAPKLKEEVFDVKVWRSLVSSTVPVYGSSWDDDRNMLFTTDKNFLTQHNVDARRVTGNARKSLGRVYFSRADGLPSAESSSGFHGAGLGPGRRQRVQIRRQGC
ncbi:MAG: hypothetical protein U0361_25015 [Nitrospiraceae bacterium]